MKTLFVLASLMVVLFLVEPNNVEAQKGTSTKNKAGRAFGAGCAVTVRDDLVPNRKLVVVGCDSLGAVKSPDGNLNPRLSNGGIVVLDEEMRPIYKWEASSSAGGFFGHFAGTKNVKGHNALMVYLVNGPVADATGRSIQNTVPLYFDGKKFRFAEMPE